MAYASRSGRARTSIRRPQAFAVCDRCGIWYNRVNLSWQYDWRGNALQNLWILVCGDCLDIPQEQLRAIQLPADPVPVWQPRVEQFASIETDYRTTLPIPTDPIVGIPVPARAALRVTQAAQNRIPQPIGCPDGLVQNAVMPYNGGLQEAFAVPLAILSAVANGTATVSVTCSKAHGLQTGAQVSVEGLTSANGFYSVTVISATAFSYLTVNNVPAGSLLGHGPPRILTTQVGLQYNASGIPKIGCEPVVPSPFALTPILTESGDDLYSESGGALEQG
jgi:hypothetical protein